MKLLTTHSTSCIGCYLCLFMQAQFQLGSCVVTFMHAQMKYVLIANLQDLIPTLAAIIIARQHKLAKVGIKSCRFAIECVSLVRTCMDVNSYPAIIVFA